MADDVNDFTMLEYDLKAQEHSHILAKEVEKTRKVKAEKRPYVAFLFSAPFLLTLTLFFIYSWISLPPGIDNEAEREKACISNGGGYVTDDILSSYNKGLCVYPGKVAE